MLTGCFQTFYLAKCQHVVISDVSEDHSYDSNRNEQPRIGNPNYHDDADHEQEELKWKSMVNRFLFVHTSNKLAT